MGGGGPVLVNLITHYEKLDTDILPPQRVIHKYTIDDPWPELSELANKRIAITAGNHKIWSRELTESVNKFCASHDAVVLVDHSSGYKGKYSVHATLPASQELYDSQIFDIDLLIHIGEEHGDYITAGKLHRAKEVWRVSEDGELRDTFRKLTKVFQIPEQIFFEAYSDPDYKPESTSESNNDYYRECQAEINEVKAAIPDLPFSNMWLAQNMAANIPDYSYVHLGVSNTQRAWTFFDFPESVTSIANAGCRGIDGALSSALGMSLVNQDKIHFCILGDLTFFYNMNALGNRNVKNNLRVLLVNNAGGAEFRLYTHPGQRFMGDDSAPFVAAQGHSGNKSPDLIRHYSQDLGFEYLHASNKDEAEHAIKRFLTPELTDKPLFFEAFTNYQNESDALKMIQTCKKDPHLIARRESILRKTELRNTVKKVIGSRGVAIVRALMGKNLH